MLPGFIPRLHTELVRTLTTGGDQDRNSERRLYSPYASLRPLLPFIGILNDPSPPPPTTAKSSAGKAPAFSPAALPWVGGSLAGSDNYYIQFSVSDASPFFLSITVP